MSLSAGGGPFGVVVTRSIQTLALPALPDGVPPINSNEWYDAAIKLPEEGGTVPPLRVRGYFGATLGSHERDEDVMLLLWDEDPLKPIARLIIDRHDLLVMFGNLGRLLEDRLQLLKGFDLQLNGPFR